MTGEMALAILDSCIEARKRGDEVVMLATKRTTNGRHVRVAKGGPRGVPVAIADDGSTVAVFPIDAIEGWVRSARE